MSSADEQQRLAALRYDDGSGTAAPSVAAAFELSYRRLDETSARVFRLLPVNPGPDISTAAAAALADLPARQVRTVLAGLARAHLAEAAPGAAGRWRMHDLLRLYAQRLSDDHAEADGREQARDRLLGYYLDTADAADDHLRALPGMAVPDEFTGRDGALAWLDAERASLVAAVTMAAETGRDQAAMRLPLLLAEYFGWRRRFDDWITATTISLDAARRLGDRRREGDALTILGLALRAGAAVRGGHHRPPGRRRHLPGDRRPAPRGHGAEQPRQRPAGGAAVRGGASPPTRTISRSAGRPATGTARAWRWATSAWPCVEVRRFEEAITAYQDAAAIFRETGDRHREGMALSNLGLALREVRRFEEAITAHQDAAAIFRETGDRHREGMALNNLGLALVQVRRFEEAITAHQDAAAIYRETGDRHGEGMALGNLGLALVEVRRFEEAITAYQDAAAIYRETGDRHGEGMALESLGLALQEMRRFDEAITAYQDALAIYRETGDRYREYITLGDLETAKAAQRA